MITPTTNNCSSSMARPRLDIRSSWLIATAIVLIAILINSVTLISAFEAHVINVTATIERREIITDDPPMTSEGREIDEEINIKVELLPDETAPFVVDGFVVDDATSTEATTTQIIIEEATTTLIIPEETSIIETIETPIVIEEVAPAIEESKEVESTPVEEPTN